MFGFDNKYPYTDFHELNLDWVLAKIKAHQDNIDEIFTIINAWADTAEKIKALYEAIISGNFPPEVIAALTDWMRENALDIVGDLVHMVFFGLTNDGYFCAFIPESWEDITFNTTGYDIQVDDIDFGHLTLSY